MATALLDKFVDNAPVSEKLWTETVEKSTQHERSKVEGHWREGDLCLRKTYMKVGHERLRRVHRYVEHPTDGVESTHIIHAILVYDHRADGKDNGARIVEGGIGQNHIIIGK